MIYLTSGPRHCDLSPYTNETLSSLVSHQTALEVVKDDEPVIVESSTGRKYEVDNDGFNPVIDLPSYIWEDELTGEHLATCTQCTRNYVVEDLDNFDNCVHLCGDRNCK